MRITKDTPSVEDILVFQRGGEPGENSPPPEHRLNLIGCVVSVDDEEGWADLGQADGSVKRVQGDFVIVRKLTSE